MVDLVAVKTEIVINCFGSATSLVLMMVVGVLVFAMFSLAFPVLACIFLQILTVALLNIVVVLGGMQERKETVFTLIAVLVHIVLVWLIDK